MAAATGDGSASCRQMAAEAARLPLSGLRRPREPRGGRYGPMAYYWDLPLWVRFTQFDPIGGGAAPERTVIPGRRLTQAAPFILPNFRQLKYGTVATLYTRSCPTA